MLHGSLVGSAWFEPLSLGHWRRFFGGPKHALADLSSGPEADEALHAGGLQLLWPECQHSGHRYTSPPCIMAATCHAGQNVGIQKLGDAAVPLNLLILGSSLSQGADFEALPLRVGMAITVCKMVVMPLLMSLIVYGLIRLVDGKDPAMWLVALIVTCTPTANNVGIMAHLGGQKVESMATAIFIQYVFAPVLIAMSLTYFMWLLSSEWYLPASSV